MDWVARGVGLFYLVSGALILREALTARGAGPAAHGIDGRPGPAVERVQAVSFHVGAALCLASGLALALLSRWAPPLFLSGCAAQAAYLVWAARFLPSEAPQAARDRRQTIQAFVLYGGVTLFVLWLDGRGALG